MRGLLPPEAFVPVAEEIGLIGDLGSFVLEEACNQMADWRARLPERSHMTVSVNISPRQFQRPALVADVKRALEKSGLPPSALILEITESAVMRDVEPTIAKLHQLKEMGVRLAVDDFGTGYSSLAYLKRLPIDLLKIDQAFIEGIVDNQDDAAIVRAVITLGRSLDLTLIAEGVETAAQASLLEGWECDRGQGYRYAAPADADTTEAMLALPAPFAELRHAA
jgi:EAL domain-containing protein (putative c-di-GMP-specific phosphodiesterase class I)